MTTSGFLPPSSRHGDCRWRPHSSPISAPTALEPVKPTLSTRPRSSACSRPGERLRAVGQHEVEHAVGQRRRAGRAGPAPRRARARTRPASTPTALPHSSAGTRYHDGTATGKLPAVMIAATPTGVAEGEQLLVGHLRRHGLAVEPPALADEEVAGVDDLLDLAERLGVGLADLARDQARERLLVVLDQPAELLRSRGRARARARRPTRAGPRARPRRRRRRWPASPSRTSATTSLVSDGLVEVSWPPGASVAGRPAMIEATVRDMRLNLAWSRRTIPRVGSRSAAHAPMRPVMRRLLVLPLLLAGLVLAPAAAQAATPGVNIVGSADVAAAAATGAKTVRVFAVRSSFPAAYPDFQNIVTAARASGMGVVFVLVGSRDGAATDPADFANFAAAFATQMKSVGGAAAYEVWNEEDETDFWGAAGRRGALRRDPQGRVPRDQGSADPRREGPARAADRQQLQLPRAGLRRRRRRLLRRRRGPHRHRLPRRPAELLLSRGRQRRALHLPGLPHRPRRDGRQRRRRQADLDDRAGLDDHDLDLRARHVGGPEARGRHRGRSRPPTSRRPTTASPATPTSRPGCGSRSRTRPATATSSTTTGSQRTDGSHKPAWDAFHSVATQGDQLTGPCGDFDAPSLTISAPGTERAVRRRR